MSRHVLPCGTRAAYVRGCRCPACCTANGTYHRGRNIGQPKLVGVETLHPVNPPGPWINDAACRGLESDLFFPDKQVRVANEIRTVCNSCPVRWQCLDWALDNHIKDGWWGGKSPTERRKLKRRQPRLEDTPTFRVDEVQPSKRYL